MKDRIICAVLVEKGRELLGATREPNQFTKVAEADALLNDLDGHPHAFVLACVMDRQVKAEKAWVIPYRIATKIEGFSMAKLSQLSLTEVNRLLSQPEPLHRFVDIMSGALHSAIQRISSHYEGDAGQIWKGTPSSAEVVYRFLEFDGVGPKIATMATNILARDFKVPFADYFSIDISADVHIRRVFARLGFTPHDASVDQIIYKARALHPEFPGLMDLPCWNIGRTWCHSGKPQCEGCYMKTCCPTAAANL